ncbi:DUF3306 domain-containing protein [Photobacterium japonica]|uniref:DUF3306 domain-containing protein n=1 Tax=Photobacterium japonica TaxID=2910235 RepID=UPI003D0A663F
MATNFFQRWSNRKLQAREEKAQDTPTDASSAQDTRHSAVDVANHAAMDRTNREGAGGDTSALTESALTERETRDTTTESNTTEVVTDEQEAAALPTLNDVVNVSFDSGVTNFMKTGVEKSVKKAALRKLFHSDEFNYISDMDDHTEDFSNIPALDAKVTAQLRGWVNKAVEQVEGMLDEATSQTARPESAVSTVVDEIDSGVTLPDSLAQYCEDGESLADQTADQVIAQTTASLESDITDSSTDNTNSELNPTSLTVAKL